MASFQRLPESAQPTLAGSAVEREVEPQVPGKRVFAWSPGFAGPSYYTYDELSNQVSVAGGPSFTYNAERNRLLAKDALTYTYDAAGFATSRGGVPITWTAAGRLASYGSATAEWDLSGRL